MNDFFQALHDLARVFVAEFRQTWLGRLWFWACYRILDGLLWLANLSRKGER